MDNLFKRYRFSRELKRLAKENAELDKPLCLMDNIVFKAMLGANSDDSNEALRSLLSACTGREISSVRVDNGELLPPHLDGKTPRLDVHVTFNDGEAADMEMQVEKTDDDLRDRAALYTAMLQALQSKKGHFYKDIKRVYQIFFLNCILFPQSDKLPRRYYYKEEKENDRLTNATEIIFYELPKLEQRVRDILEGKAEMESLSNEEKWCIYMRYRHEARASKLIEKLSVKEEGIMRAERAVEKIDRDYWKAARKMAELKNSMDEAQRQYNAMQKGLAEGLAEGRAEGLVEGRAEGRTEGRIEGRIEGRTERDIEIALKMKNAGRPLSEIAEFTGLPLETIANLK